MKAGWVYKEGQKPYFDSFVLHRGIQNKEYTCFDTQHKSIAKIIHPTGEIEYVFWDEAGLGCWGGYTFDEAVIALNRYCDWLNGTEPKNEG